MLICMHLYLNFGDSSFLSPIKILRQSLNLQRRRHTAGGISRRKPAIYAGVELLKLDLGEIGELRDTVDGGGVQRLVLRRSEHVLGENPQTAQVLLSCGVAPPVILHENLELLLRAQKLVVPDF